MGQVLIKVQACGVCHSDSLTKEGLFPGVTYPRVPGHEIAGVIEAIGPQCIRLANRATCGCWLVWWALWLLFILPARRFYSLQTRQYIWYYL